MSTIMENMNEIYFLPHKLQTREEFAKKSLVPSTLLILPCLAFLPLAKVGKIWDQQDHLFQDSLQMGNQTREKTTFLVSLNIVKGLMDPTEISIKTLPKAQRTRGISSYQTI